MEKRNFMTKKEDERLTLFCELLDEFRAGKITADDVVAKLRTFQLKDLDPKEEKTEPVEPVTKSETQDFKDIAKIVEDALASVRSFLKKFDEPTIDSITVDDEASVSDQIDPVTTPRGCYIPEHLKLKVVRLANESWNDAYKRALKERDERTAEFMRAERERNARLKKSREE